MPALEKQGGKPQENEESHAVGGEGQQHRRTHRRIAPHFLKTQWHHDTNQGTYQQIEHHGQGHEQAQHDRIR